MSRPPPDPPISDVAPADRHLTSYDQEHLVTYLHLLDADAEGADWQEVAKIVLYIDPKREPNRAKRAWEAIWPVRRSTNAWLRLSCVLSQSTTRIFD
jgi:hypothetical protein